MRHQCFSTASLRRDKETFVLICPECNTSNPDGAALCESCNTSFGLDSVTNLAGRNEQATEVAALVSSPFSSPLSSAAAARGFAGLVPGDVIAARYEIITSLGQGGMGSVYQALDRELDRVIALKTIRPDLASNASVLRRFKTEILLARQITHRNVIRIFDFGVAEGLRFITMEFVEGEDLKSRLKRQGRFAPDDAVAIMRQICDGLQAAHAEDVIHRDLKPQNILIDRQNHIRIMDFGLARSFEAPHVTQTGALLGTPDYMSPEQARGERADLRSDIFAAGLIFYELLTGDLPFKADSVVEKLLRRTRERARPPEFIHPATPKRLSGIVMRCLETDPASRYPSAYEIVCDLDNPESLVSSSRSGTPVRLGPGTMLGSRYRIDAEAGEGGMGKVYRATDLDLGRTVALKVVRSELAGDPQNFERLKREILLASRVTHRHVLRIHDLGEADGVRFVSMAWVDGEDLATLIGRTGPLAEDRLLALAKQLCEGLEAAHREGVIHRDLKPHNVLLDSSGNVCISDFGLAETLNVSERTPSGQDSGVSGTPRYMSPEQVQGKAVDQRTDIYSLGLVLYEMATGVVPFRDSSALETMLQRVTETPKSPKLLIPALSDKLAQVILRCLEQDPAKRYQSARELSDELRSEKPRTKKRAIAVAAVAVVLLVIAAAFFLFRSKPRSVPHLTSAAPAPAAPPMQSAGAYDLYLRGRQILKDHQDEKGVTAALDLFNQANQKEPAFALAWTGVADASLDMYRYKRDSFWADKALAAAREAQARNDRLPEVHFALGSVYTQMGKNADAVSEIRRALQLDPKSDNGYVRLGRAYLQMGQPEAALTAFRKAVDLNPFYWGNHDQLGKAYYRTGRNDDALREFKRVAELDPANASVHNSMGIIYSRQSLWDSAIAEFQKTIQLRPSHEAYTNLGTAYFYAGRHSEAIPMFEKAVALDPQDELLVGNLADEYRHAKLDEKARATYDRAIQLAYQRLQINPRDAKVLGNLALYHAREGKLPEAQDLIHRARTYNPSDNLLMYDEAVIYALAGRPQDGLTALERALASGFSLEEARSDPDLANVRALPGYAAALKKLVLRRSPAPGGHAHQQNAKQK